MFFPQNQLLNFSKRKASLEAEHRSNTGNNRAAARKGSKGVKQSQALGVMQVNSLDAGRFAK